MAAPGIPLSALLLLAAMACQSSAPTRPAAGGRANDPPKVVVLGDSLTAGPGLRTEETLPARLQERVRAAGYPHIIVNAGVSGDTTAGGLARLERALEPGTTVLVVALGANDGLRGVPVETVRGNLAAIIERAQQRGLKVLLCGMETLPSRGWEYTLDFHRIYPELAQRYSVSLMPFLLADVAGRAELNLEDGWHPNAAGARVMADNMWPYLEPLLR